MISQGEHPDLWSSYRPLPWVSRLAKAWEMDFWGEEPRTVLPCTGGALLEMGFRKNGEENRENVQNMT